MEAAVRWSPHSTSGRERFLLVDVTDQSLTLNHVSSRSGAYLNYLPVAKYGRLPNFSAFDWSKTDESVVALGLVSGSASLVRLREGGHQSETVHTFKLKQQRKANSVALSTREWLAVALDKTRSDNCLNIFDANTDQTGQEPVRRLCPAEVVSSVRFFPGQPQELVVAAQRAYIRLYDLRDGYLAGSNSSLQVSTRCVNNIAIDPLDENYFASAGSTDDPSVTIWDKRWMTQSSPGGSGTGAVFELRPAVNISSRATIWSLRYSGQQRGRLAICSSRGELKVVDMVEGRNSPTPETDFRPTNPHGGSSWSCNRYVSASRSVTRPFEETDSGLDFESRLIAFDWIPDSPHMAEQSVLALRPNREVSIIRVPRTIPHATITARNDLSMAFDELSVVETSGRVEPTKPQAPYEQQRTAEDFGPHDYRSEEDTDQTDEFQVLSPHSPQVPNLLAQSSIQRERCHQGYLWDCRKNMGIVTGHWQLERLWEIINRFREQSADGAMVGEDLDLSFVGVAGICQENIGNVSRRTYSPAAAKVEDAIYALNITRELPPFEGERTEFPEHRQLCLELCGWKFTTETLEAECQELIERGLYYQAIVQAVLHDYKHIALNILRTLIRSKTVPNIGLGALLASDSINKEQREMCNWMAADTEDAALKALLTFLTTGDWRDVMRTKLLHLGYRVALGLKYLNDTELKGFMQTESARAIKNGDLEGILLTGLGEQSMHLFQTYITKTNDLQTAVLATAFTNPLYVDDVRWEMWKETYFMQMQSWRAFVPRSQFVIQHSQMARANDGHSLLERPAAQVTLRCKNCHEPLARHDGRSTNKKNRTVQANGKPAGRPEVMAAASAGIVCPSCGVHMPRCGICKMWLGTPDPARRGGARELSKLNDVMAKFLTFCVNCQHGFHAHHARSWFKKHDTCPVPDCQCLCFVV